MRLGALTLICEVINMYVENQPPSNTENTGGFFNIPSFGILGSAKQEPVGWVELGWVGGLPS